MSLALGDVAAGGDRACKTRLGALSEGSHWGPHMDLCSVGRARAVGKEWRDHTWAGRLQKAGGLQGGATGKG